MEHAGLLASDQTWAAFASAAPSIETDMAAQLLEDHWAPHEQEHEWIEAMAAMLFPSLDGDSNPSSAWPQVVHSTTSTDIGDGNAFFAPIIYENLEPAESIIHSNAQSISIAHQTSISSISTKRNLDMVDSECEKLGTNKKRSGAAAKAARRSKKTEKRVDSLGSDEDYNDYNADMQSSSRCITSGEESLELGNAKSNSGEAATKAGRRPTTDAQCLYARKRRGRINERLRILQNLVPNGKKVDISTMLEEAVQYVKFLQLQIKLLSSDDLWMYAPIAYNGVNISNVDPNISLPKTK